MRFPGFGRSDKRVIVDAQNRQYVETQPGVVLRTDAPASDAAYARGVNDARAQTNPASDAAYARGVNDARTQTNPAADRAYAAGRQDERASRAPPRRSGGMLVALLLLVLIVVAVAWVINAYPPGTMTRAGAAVGNAVDAPLTAAHDQAAGAADAVKARTGQAVENAGQALTNQGEKLKNKGEKIKSSDGN